MGYARWIPVRRFASSLLLSLVLVLAVVAAVGTAYLVAGRLAPERLRVETEDWLAARLDVPVEIGRVRPVFHGGLALEILGLRAGAKPEAAGLTVPRGHFVLNLRGLLLGGTPVRRIVLEGGDLRLERSADGSWQPAGLARRWGELRGAEAESTARRRWGRRLVDAVRFVSNAPTEIPSLVVTDTRIHLTVVPPGRAEPVVWSVVGRDVRLSRRLFGAKAHLEASLELAASAGGSGRLELRGEVEEKGSIELDAEVRDLDLALLAPLIAPWLSLDALGGHAEGTLAWDSVALDRHRLSGRLGLRQLRLTALPSLAGQPLELARERLALAFEAEAEPDALHLRDARLSTGELEVRVGGRAARPLGPESATFLALRATQVSLPALRDRLLELLPGRFEALRSTLSRLEAGRIVSLLVRRRDTPLSAWRRVLQGRDGLSFVTQGTRIEAELADLELTFPERRLRGASAQLLFDDGNLELDVPGWRLDGDVLPALRLELRGAQAWLERPPLPEPPAALPGLAPLWAWLERQREPDGPRTWSRVEIREGFVLHPALGGALTGVELDLMAREHGLRARLERGRFAGVPVTGHAAFDRREAPGRLSVALAATASDAAPANGTPEGPWAGGVVRAEIDRLGRFPAQAIEAHLRAIGSSLHVEVPRLGLRRAGSVKGELELDLGRAEEAPFHARLQLEDGSLDPLLTALGFEQSGLEGAVVTAAELRGALTPERPLVATLRGPLSLHARDGAIRRRLPIVIAIAEASETLNPLVSRDTVSFRAIDAMLELDAGTLLGHSLSLDGPSLRLVATGNVGLLAPEHPLEAVVGVFFFRKLDAVIDKVPVLNRLLLGADENFVAAYFAVTGPWEDPDASFIPAKSIATGPGSVVMVGLPNFVRGGLERLQTLVAGGWRAGTEPFERKPSP